jgi:hypothetical protein
MANYFNTLSLGQKLDQLSKCRFMETSEFESGVDALKEKKNCNYWLRSTRFKPRIKHERFGP